MVCECIPSFGQAVFVLLTFFLAKHLLPKLIRLIRGQKPETPELQEKNWKKDVVYLYQFPRVPSLPNISPFCLKLETFLRIHKIEYEVRYSLRLRSKYGLLPFIELNGEHFADSLLIMNELTKRFNVQVYQFQGKHKNEQEKENLTPEQQAVSHYLQRSAEKFTMPLINREKMLYAAEASVRNGLAQWKLVPEFFLPLVVPLVAWVMRTRYVEVTNRQIGTFSESEFRALLVEDIDHLRVFLGDKKFLFGDQPTTADATLFGALASNFFPSVNHYGMELLKSPENKKVAEYLERVRDAAFTTDFEQK